MRRQQTTIRAGVHSPGRRSLAEKGYILYIAKRCLYNEQKHDGPGQQAHSKKKKKKRRTNTKTINLASLISHSNSFLELHDSIT